jgi:hypothetical protein
VQVHDQQVQAVVAVAPTRGNAVDVISGESIFVQRRRLGKEFRQSLFVFGFRLRTVNFWESNDALKIKSEVRMIFAANEVPPKWIALRL